MPSTCTKYNEYLIVISLAIYTHHFSYCYIVSYMVHSFTWLYIPILVQCQVYIDFEISEHEYEKTRQLYERLLDRTRHLKVWISYAKFEASAGLEDKEVDGEAKSENHDASSQDQQMERVQRCRGNLSKLLHFSLLCYLKVKIQILTCFLLLAVFERAFDYFRTSAPELKEERAMLLEEWLNMESSFGSLGDVSIVQKKLPRKVKRKRAITSEDDAPAGYALSLSFSISLSTVNTFPSLSISLSQLLTLFLTYCCFNVASRNTTTTYSLTKLPWRRI